MTDKRKLTLKQAQKQFPHRFTMEHVPRMAKDMLPNNKYPAPQYRTDQEWYDNTVFHGEPGHFGPKNTCVCTAATFPMGAFLDEPYKVKA